ncbi:MAG: beta-ketoacyl synthase N-terminal-like domain-containing protein [Pseudomonadota bacterium]|nr:beta-ketoacyl synthase N-terminal-like domain-containing protein [Pseudomonadota bacterium]
MTRAAVIAVGRVLPTRSLVGAAPSDADEYRVDREDPSLARVRRQMSRGAWLAALAVHDALAGAALLRAEVDPARTAAFLAVGAATGALDDVLRILAASTTEDHAGLDLERFARRGVAACNPLLAFQLMNNFTLCHSAIREGLQGPSGAFFDGAGGGPWGAGEPAATHALREGIRALADVPWALVGAADSLLHPVTRFERAQAGLGGVPGEGAVVLLLAREEVLSRHDGAPLAWVEIADGVGIADGVEIVAGVESPSVATKSLTAYGDLGAVAPTLAWLDALGRLQEGQADVVIGRVRFSGHAREGTGGRAAPARSGAPRADRAQRVSPEAPGPAPTPLAAAGGRAHASGCLATRRAPIPRQAVITGVGVASAFGLGIDALWDGLLAGAPALAPAAHLPGFPPVGAVPRGDPLAAVDPELRAAWAARGWLRDRRLPLAVHAALEAWAGAGLARAPVVGAPSTPLGLSLALGLEQAWLADFLPLVTPGGLDWTRDPGGPALRYRAPLDLPARALREALGCGRGAPTIVHASACAGGALAVGHAAAWIVAGEADRVLCGGADSMLNPLGMAGLQKLGVLSPRGVCRPFDPRRDGIVVGEGAACFVVEEEGAARRRGAPILARIAGWGSAQDGYAPTAPRPGGAPAARAMAAALARAGVAPSVVAYVNAHGTGTPLNDEAEAGAILDLFPPCTPVGSFKGAIGHTMAAAGALELAGCLVAFARGVLPGTVGFETPDPRCPVALVRTARAFDGRYVLSNSFGFGGQDGSVLLERP